MAARFSTPPPRGPPTPINYPTLTSLGPHGPHNTVLMGYQHQQHQHQQNFYPQSFPQQQGQGQQRPAGQQHQGQSQSNCGTPSVASLQMV